MDATTELIRDIYAAALDEQPWQDIVDRTASLLGATGAFLFTTFVAESDGGLAISSGLPKRETQRFLTEVATVDVWFQTLLRRHGRLQTGFSWQTDDLLSEQALHKTRFFNDYLVPCDIGRNMGTMVGDGSSDAMPLMPLCVYRPVCSRPFSGEDEAMLRALQPHFTRSVSVRQRLLETRRDASALAIERVSTAVVVLAADRKILLANPAAEALFAKAVPSLVRQGRLSPVVPAQGVALERALQACASYRFDDRLSLSVRLGGEPGRGIVARLAPPPQSTPKGARTAAIAFLVEEGRSPPGLTAIVTSLYRLTPSEAALVEALADGLQPADIAATRRVALSTVKTQLRSIFTKTGTKRQSDLMRLVFSIR